jgi:hypothetical protein
MVWMWAGCGDGGAQRLGREEFTAAYGDAIYLSELYRGRPQDIRSAIDSMLRVRGTDTTVFFASARFYAAREDDIDTVYARLVRRFEEAARNNSPR